MFKEWVSVSNMGQVNLLRWNFIFFLIFFAFYSLIQQLDSGEKEGAVAAQGYHWRMSPGREGTMAIPFLVFLDCCIKLHVWQALKEYFCSDEMDKI